MYIIITFLVFLSYTSINAITIFDSDFISITILSLHFILRFAFVVLHYKRNAALLLWAFFELSFFSYLGFSSGYVYDVHLHSLNINSIKTSICYGSFFIVVFIISSILFYFLPKKVDFFSYYFLRKHLVKSETTQFFDNNSFIPEKLTGFIVFYIITICSSFISYFLGITVMGSEVTELPFKIGGALNNYRILFAPLLFIYFIDRFHYSNKSTLIIFCFFIWSLLEAYIKLSKGVLILNMLLVFLWFSYESIEVSRKFKFYSVVVIVVSIFIFGAIDDARISYNSNYVASESNDAILIDSFNKMIFRSFLDGYHLAKFYEYKLGKDSLLNEINNAGGPARFHTQDIDGLPADINHSSGSSLFAEAYLIGGVTLCVIICILYAGFAFALDKLASKRKYKLICICLLYQLLYSTNMGIFTIFVYQTSYLVSIIFLLITSRIQVRSATLSNLSG